MDSYEYFMMLLNSCDCLESLFCVSFWKSNLNFLSTVLLRKTLRSKLDSQISEILFDLGYSTLFVFRFSQTKSAAMKKPLFKVLKKKSNKKRKLPL